MSITIKEPLVFGIDPSTITGVCVLGATSQTVLEKIEVRHKGSGLERAIGIGGKVGDLLDKYEPDLVVIEGYAFANTNTLALLVEVGTMIRYAVYSRNVEVLQVAPTSLKKFITGKGTGAKDKVMLEAYKRWGIEGTNNEVDAYGLAMMGSAYLGHLQMPALNSESLKKVSIGV